MVEESLNDCMPLKMGYEVMRNHARAYCSEMVRPVGSGYSLGSKLSSVRAPS